MKRQLPHGYLLLPKHIQNHKWQQWKRQSRFQTGDLVVSSALFGPLTSVIRATIDESEVENRFANGPTKGTKIPMSMGIMRQGESFQKSLNSFTTALKRVSVNSPSLEPLI